MEVGWKSGIRTDQLQHTKAVAAKPSLKEPEARTNHALTGTSVALTPDTSLGGQSRISGTEICCDKQMRKSWQVLDMAAEQTRTMMEGVGGEFTGLLALTSPLPPPLPISPQTPELTCSAEENKPGGRRRREQEHERRSQSTPTRR